MSSSARTPAPTDLTHIKVLMERNWQRDCRKKPLWFARLLAAPLLWMFYTMGFLFADKDATVPYEVFGDYRLFRGEPISIPQTMVVGASDPILLTNTSIVDSLSMQSAIRLEWDAQNSSEFQYVCNQAIQESLPADIVCVYLNDEISYTLYFGGGLDNVAPYDRSLAGAQFSIQNALLETPVDVTQFQKMPELNENEDNGPADIYITLFPGIMLVLATAISLQFVMAPLATEKFKEVIRSFLVVGVKLRVYLLQWFLYLGLQALVTAGLLTVVSFVWKLFPESSAGLVFLSHYLGLLHLFVVALVLVQLSNQEELTQGLPWLMAIFSCVIAIVWIVLVDDDTISIGFLGIVSPFIGIIQYTAIYSNYDREGFGTGIHGENLAESGLLASLLVQILGIVLWSGVAYVWTMPHRAKGTAVHSNEVDPTESEPLAAKFENLPPNADVLLSVRGLSHTFQHGPCQSATKNVNVLNGLDLDICRGEVFGYLGHNSSGKTTSIRILSGELPLQDGCVTYHFQDGDAIVSTESDLASVRRKIGICPQHNDVLHGDVSCRDFLRLFAKLKGRIPIEDGQTLDDAVEAEVERRIDEIKFTSPEDADKLIDTYSGGMKRKVCIALAFLADPEVVFLDEPSAGIDPYNRRQVWDMIIGAKRGRSIILTTHFLDEADILSDRVGILKNGRLVTCGTTLFLKHQIGGYKLRYESDSPLSVALFVNNAEPVGGETNGVFEWDIQHGSENDFPTALRNLEKAGARNVSLELTSLEQVFLETGKEDVATGDGSSNDDDPESQVDVSDEMMMQLWEPVADKCRPTELVKLLMVTRFMFSNAMKIRGAVFLNIIQPLIYVMIGFLVVGSIDEGHGDEIVPEPVPMTSYLAGSSPSLFFGAGNLTNQVFAPIVGADEPRVLEDLFQTDANPYLGGFYASNQTLQYNETLSPFALQVGLQVLANSGASLEGNSGGIASELIQLPYTNEAFRTDLLLLPMMLVFGFSGLVFSVLDILLLKADNIISLFRVTGISEWTTYKGVVVYKSISTFIPFFILVIALGISTDSVLFGNGGRWLGTILVMLGYAYSTTPLGLLLAKRFITKDFKSAANVFPGVYMTLVSLPYIAWSIALQAVPEARDALLIVGDFLCIVPPVAFQRGIGAVIDISAEANDPNLSWGDVWSWENRIWFVLLMMIALGTLQWAYLYRLTTERPPTTKLAEDESSKAYPSSSNFFGVRQEKDRSIVDDSGINARELVKLFRVKPGKGARDEKPFLKAAVKGVSFGIKRGTCMAVVGPNGAGKSVAMGILAGEHTPEHGTVALENKLLDDKKSKIDHMFAGGDIAYCPQFDALFPKKTIREHLHFYARVRGLNLETSSTKAHIDAIIRLLGLFSHLDKLATEISGGYKRRTCLANAMVGYPKLMMVDECTTGMDPGARHLVWKVMKPDDIETPAILWSTHYMDEAAKLGDHIAFFIDGEISSTGTLKELETEYCRSFFVEIALTHSGRDQDKQKVIAAFQDKGMDPSLYESLPFHFKLQIPFNGSRSQQLPEIFEVLLEHKQDLNIQFFSVQMMNLEQIFIDLSRKQFAVNEPTRMLRASL